MDELNDYLKARDHIKEFYEYVVWKKLAEKIDELCEEIKAYDETVYQGLQGIRAIPYLKRAIINTLFGFDKFDQEKPKNWKELAEQEITVIDAIPGELKKVLKQVYIAFDPDIQGLNDKELEESLNKEGFHPMHLSFRKINTKIRYPNKNPYIKEPYKAHYEFFEFNTGVVHSVMSARDFNEHVTDRLIPRKFREAGRKVYDPLTKIEIPSNYIMLANLCISCVYEIIELMQIWIDSNKIAKKAKK